MTLARRLLATAVIATAATFTFTACGDSSQNTQSSATNASADSITLPATKEWSENSPQVTFNGEQPPTTVIPDAAPPAELVLKVIKAGTGEPIKKTDTVTLNYQGLDWATKEIFQQSFGQQPAPLPVTGVIPGFGAALIGQKPGAQLVVGIPPADGYGTDPAEHELAGKTLVFVIEIISVSGS